MSSGNYAAEFPVIFFEGAKVQWPWEDKYNRSVDRPAAQVTS